jgi:hypothetical protein
VFCQELSVTVCNNARQLAPWQDVEPIAPAGADWRELDHNADQVWIRNRQWASNDLFQSLKRNISELTSCELPRIRCDCLDLDESVAALIVHRHDVIRRHISSECRRNEPTT